MKHFFYQKNLNTFLSLLVVISAIVYACSDIIETDLSKVKADEFILYSPADSTEITKLTQAFKWKRVIGATRYRIQLGSPSLSNPVDFYYDSTTTDSSHVVKIDTGIAKPLKLEYQWRILAFNANTTATSHTRYFTVKRGNNTGGTDVIAPGKPTLVTPVDKDTTFLTGVDEATITLKWRRAGDIDIKEDNLFLYNQDVLKDGFPKRIQKTESDPIVLGVGTYFWQVQSIDNAGNIGEVTDKKRFTIRKK